ncbi:MAG TPA: hypothetical protein VFB96_20125 [Pirellulaceae bacterium]|nr:hypothetical protein [Pirellulaceae bacterium]
MIWNPSARMAPILIGLCVSQLGCGEPKITSDELPDLLSIKEEGFADLTFRITDAKQRRDGSWRVVGKAHHRDRVVSLAVVLEGAWRESKTRSFGRVIYESVGPESDALVSAMSEIYEAEIKPVAMTGEVAFVGATLEGKPSELRSQPVKMKLFFESEKEDRYAEVYTNIDLPKAVLEIREKDPGYRAPLLRALGGL